MLRGFTASVIGVARQWFEHPIQPIALEQAGLFTETADGASRVVMQGGRVAYLKPRPQIVANPVVAREKIVADLAHVLGLPVAPVVVRVATPGDGFQGHTALSLSCLPGARHWDAGGIQHIASVAGTLERLRVFWTWIGDYDHNNHGQNLLYEVSDGHCQVVAIDHSYSLGKDNRAPLEQPASDGYGTRDNQECDHPRREMTATIMSLDWGNIKEIVQRLSDILTSEEQGKILEVLEKRRGGLRDLLGMKE